MAKEYLCIDVGGSAIKYALIDDTHTISEHGQVPTPYEGIDSYLATLTDLYRQFAEKIEGIALSVPGIIDSDNGVCITGGALRFIENFSLVAELQKTCPVPIAVMNDAKSAALAESKQGALADCRDGIVLILGTGIGGALVKDGQVHMGKHFSAGEFSFITFSENVDQEACKWSGINGIPRLIRMAANVKKLDPKVVTGYDVFRWAEEGDEKVLKVLDHFTRNLALMIFNLQVIFDPERVAIGGGISRQPLLLEYISKNLDYFYDVNPMCFPKAEVVTCKFFNEANLIGAYENLRLRMDISTGD